ncbi:MAG TPA: 50S ribosomal protein L24 [bacterium]
MAKIRKGDTVAVLSGKDRGKTGKVLQVWHGEGRVLVERVNLVKHFERRSQQNPAGGVIEREGPLPIAKLALVCPKCKRASRVGWDVTAGGRRRVCRRCHEPVEGS